MVGHVVKASAVMISLSAIAAGVIAYFPYVQKLADLTSAAAPAAANSMPVGALSRSSAFADAAAAAPRAPAPRSKPAATEVAAAHRKLADAMNGGTPADGLSQIARAAGGPSFHSTLGRAAGASQALAFAEPTQAPESAEATADLIRRAKAQLRDGAASSARLLLTRAARGGSAEALTMLGESYDAAALSELGAKGVRPDAAEAMKYYRQAAAAGSETARRRLANLGA